MRISCLPALLLAALAQPLQAQDLSPLEAAIRSRIARDTAVVSVVFRDPSRRQELQIEGQRRYHAASTMKVPVLIELVRRIDAGDFRWDQPIPVRNAFRSIVDGSPFSLDAGDDSDSTLYRQAGGTVSLAKLARLMIVRSSNLATNLIIELLDPKRVDATAHALGADSIQVRRGVEEQKAYDRGLNNTTTAHDLAVLLQAIATGRAASGAGTDSLRAILLDQEFRGGIPAGVPSGVQVANKTGWITAIAHDAAIIYPRGRPPYVLVILTRGFPEEPQAEQLMADISRLVYAWATGPKEPKE
ncbi:MAG TPA: serine hydrolase [Gemmatimonadales bacterium]|nr:serine hydrolase [Gemmatimonadales bacterium]